MIVMLSHDNACLLPPMGHHALQQAQSAVAQQQQQPAAGSTVGNQTGSKCNVYHFELMAPSSLPAHCDFNKP